MTKRIQVKQYPATFEFNIRTELPPFISGTTPEGHYDAEMCEVRNDLLLKHMKRLKVNSPCHAYEDYVVEVVTPTLDGEIWQLGS